MLIALFVFACAVAAVFLFGLSLGYQGREQLRLEIASLRERLAESDGRYQESRRITGELLEVVKERVGLKRSPHQDSAERLFPDRARGWAEGINSVARSMPDYIPPVAKNCPQCSISVREDAWPQQCPNCQTWFGDDWPDEIDLQKE